MLRSRSDSIRPPSGISVGMIDREYRNLVEIDSIVDTVWKASGDDTSDPRHDFPVSLRQQSYAIQCLFDAKKEVVPQASGLPLIPALRFSEIQLGLRRDDQRQIHAGPRRRPLT